jgi:hypothetical protein
MIKTTFPTAATVERGVIFFKPPVKTTGVTPTHKIAD